jgi:hypothetical protein
MSNLKKQKAHKKIFKDKKTKNIKWSELVNALEIEEFFILEERDGSSVAFENKNTKQLFTVHKNDPLYPSDIKRIRKKIKNS